MKTKNFEKYMSYVWGISPLVLFIVAFVVTSFFTFLGYKMLIDSNPYMAWGTSFIALIIISPLCGMVAAGGSYFGSYNPIVNLPPTSFVMPSSRFELHSRAFKLTCIRMIAIYTGFLSGFALPFTWHGVVIPDAHIYNAAFAFLLICLSAGLTTFGYSPSTTGIRPLLLISLMVICITIPFLPMDKIILPFLPDIGPFALYCFGLSVLVLLASWALSLISFLRAKDIVATRLPKDEHWIHSPGQVRRLKPKDIYSYEYISFKRSLLNIALTSLVIVLVVSIYFKIVLLIFTFFAFYVLVLACFVAGLGYLKFQPQNKTNLTMPISRKEFASSGLRYSFRIYTLVNITMVILLLITFFRLPDLFIGSSGLYSIFADKIPLLFIILVTQGFTFLSIVGTARAAFSFSNIYTIVLGVVIGLAYIVSCILLASLIALNTSIPYLVVYVMINAILIFIGWRLTREVVALKPDY